MENDKNPKHSKGFREGGQSLKLGDRFKQDKLGPSSADSVKDVDNVLRKTAEGGPDHKQQGQKKGGEELVRYMSNLPNYLERGEKKQEKAFNVGVLEWGRLEKWQHNNQSKQLFRESSTYSPSTSNTSISQPSSKGRSTCTPGRLRTTYHATTAESNRRGSSSKVSPHGAKSSLKDVFTAADDLVAVRNDYVKVQQSILKTHQGFNKYTDTVPEEGKPKHHHRQSVSDKSPQEPDNRFVTSDSKGKLKVQDGDVLEEKEKSKGSNNQQQTVVLLRPKDVHEIKHPVAAEQSNSTKKHGRDSSRPKQRITFDHHGHPPNEQPSSVRVKEIRFPFETKRAIVHPRGSSVSPVKCRTIEDMSNKRFSDPAMVAAVKTACERALVHPRGSSADPVRYNTPEDNSNKELGGSADPVRYKTPEDNSNKELGGRSAVVSRNGALVHPRFSSVSPVRSKTPVDKWNKPITEPVEVRNPKLGSEIDNKARNISPFRRFSFSMGRIVKSSSSDDLSGLAQSSNHHAPITSCENSNANRKTTASPLRRLLDPFLKPKPGNSDHSPGSAPGHPVSRDGNGNVNVCDRVGEARALNSVKVKLDLGGCKGIGIDHSNDMDKNGSTRIQALLQVALKNGLPLFTFAVENSSDILAATMTRLSSGKKDGNNNWIFTFFTVHEMKKKSGSWLHYASKERKQGYIPNVVGQMKVSDVPNPDFIGKQSADKFRIREFVLLGVNLRQQVDEKSSDHLQANDELAAIVLKLPTLEGGHHKKTFVQKLSTVDSTDSCQQKTENLLGFTAILPGGQHGLPCNGRPSPLIERWRFGGSCDCGGWDLGCRLRVLTSENQSSSDTSKKIHLYTQDHALESKPAVSLSPFKDGIYSVEFDSSLKLLQAFSVCIAILNGLKPLEFLEMSSFFHKKSSSEEPNNNTRLNTDGAKHPHVIDEHEIPACFVSCPPGNPADRL